MKRQQRGLDSYECEKCHKLFPKSDVHIDHILPVVNPATGFTSYDEYIARLYCNANSLQILCKEDHKAKTKAENKLRTRKPIAKKEKK